MSNPYVRLTALALSTLTLAACAARPAAVPAAAGAAPAAAGAAPTAEAAPRLVVVLVVDQFRAEYVDRYGGNWTQGLRRLVDEGAYFPEAAYPYSGTVTCAGHTSIGTGALPAVHGMVLNAWWDRATGSRRACTADETVSPIGFTKQATSSAQSGRWIEVDTYAERLVGSQPAGTGRVASFSLKARSAIGLVGKRADAMAWFDYAGTFATSSAYPPPAWLRAHLAAHPIERDVAATWTRALPPAAYQGADDGPGERPSPGWTATFPHALSDGAADARFYDRWQSSPFSDAYLAGMAVAAVDAMKLGQRAGVDFLAVGFSALDIAGHRFGPDSHEVQDVLVRLDETIGRLLAHLDARVGPGGYVVALSSDHGVSDVPEARGAGAGRLPSLEIHKIVEAALEEAWGPAGGRARVADVVGTDVYLADAARARLAADDTALAAIRARLGANRAVAAVMTAGELARAPESSDPMVRARGLSHFPARSGDLLVVLREHFTSSMLAASHGTEHAYDRRVPVILFGARIERGRFPGAASPLDIAPTLARITGTTLDRAYGRSLDAAVK